MSEEQPTYLTVAGTRYVICRVCGERADRTIDGLCERCYGLSQSFAKPLAYPQPTNFLQERDSVRVDEPSLERIRALVEMTVRSVLHEEDVQEKQYFFVLNKVLSAEELRDLEQRVKEGGLQAIAYLSPDIVAIEVPTFEKAKESV